ncbi:DUF7711 family protein [Actinokineospora sp.]|uniref:DUF7711 family protein n=1 Tax=Actinokineospora sp. TaxID=1872133 RepID=UPI0040383B03
MKWIRALHHLETLAHTCADMATRPRTIFPLRVTRLWAAGDILGPVRDVDRITVALVVDLPVDEVPWLTEPHGSQHWAQAARLPQSPITVRWRSAHAPVWNHALDRPALIWDVETGVAEATLLAITDGVAETVRPAAPSAAEHRARLDDELAVSLRALRTRTATYADRRWGPGKLEPVADALWRAGEGYLDLLDATGR